ncbi:MAG TPA: hypothetical protein VGF86_12935 [Candidatus Tumulicola sp.]|jgi:hypothetical protein
MKSSFSAALVIGAVLISGCSGGLSQTPTAAGIGGGGAVSTNSSVPFSSSASRGPAVGNAFGQAGKPIVPDAVDPNETKAAAYCRSTGGTVYLRQAEYNTNGPSPLVLAGQRRFCQYTSPSDGSRIHILLATLYSTKPSLAALAYILKPPSGSCQGNPASCYCTLLGASDQFGGNSGAGGSWVNPKSEDADLEACIFPDMSSIDSWGLTYNANGIVRGIDLNTVMRYHYPGSH